MASQAVSSAWGETANAAIPVVFGSPERALVGFYHAAPEQSERASGVVLCSPLGHEAMCVHRTYRHLATRLAGAGFPTLRFDYHGTGNSTGDPGDPDLLTAWIQSIQSAVDDLRARAGTSRVALVGVRFGATLAMAAAAARGGVDALVVWAPVVHARGYVSELRAYRLLKTHKTPIPKRPDGSEESMGYLFARQTLADMAAVDVLAGADHMARRVLVIPRNEKPGSEETKLFERLAANRVDAQMASVSGYSRMMRDDPYRSEVPEETLGAIVAWLPQGEPDGGRSPSVVPSSPVLSVDGGDARQPLTETPVRFGDGARLFGVVTESTVRDWRDRPALCFLNVGANHHVGPHRMYVRMARHLASLGYLTFRFDVGGLGESLASPGAPENRLYSMASVADVKSAMTFLREARGATRFVLFGLCSGAYLAYHAAVQDRRVVGQVLLSPFAFEWKEGDPIEPTEVVHSTRSYARSLLDRGVWRRMFRGEVNVRHIAGGLLERATDHAKAEWRSAVARLNGQHGATDVERAFRDMSDRGVHSFIVLSFNDGGVDMVARYLGRNARKMRGRKNFAFQILDESDHTFMSVESQRRLNEVVTAYVTERFP